jgi:hypothetical protein
MRTAIVVLVALAGLLGAVPAALAKGPSAAVIEGPGLERPVRIESYEASGQLPGLSTLMEHTGGTVMFGSGTRLQADRPAVELGPRFAVTYLMDTEVVLRQELYPFADGGPYTFIPPGQKSIFVTSDMDSGWFRGPARLTAVMTAMGADSTAVVAAAPATPAAAGTNTGWWLGGSLTAVALVLAAGVVVTRRQRSRAVTARA